MAVKRIFGVRAQGGAADPLLQKRVRRLDLRFFRAMWSHHAILASVMAGGSLAISGVAPAGASPTSIMVHCPTDNLQDAIISCGRRLDAPRQRNLHRQLLH